MKYEALKNRQRAERHQYPEAIGLRIHRALSWLHCAGQCWQTHFSQVKKASQLALAANDTATVLNIVFFSPLYLTQPVSAWRIHMEQQNQSRTTARCQPHSG